MGVVAGDRWVPLDRLAALRHDAPGPVPPTVSELAPVWDPWVKWLTDQPLSPEDDPWLPTESARFLPAVTAPPTIYCAGANYFDH